MLHAAAAEMFEGEREERPPEPPAAVCPVYADRPEAPIPAPDGLTPVDRRADAAGSLMVDVTEANDVHASFDDENVGGSRLDLKPLLGLVGPPPGKLAAHEAEQGGDVAGRAGFDRRPRGRQGTLRILGCEGLPKITEEIVHDAARPQARGLERDSESWVIFGSAGKEVRRIASVADAPEAVSPHPSQRAFQQHGCNLFLTVGLDEKEADPAVAGLLSGPGRWIVGDLERKASDDRLVRVYHPASIRVEVTWIARGILPPQGVFERECPAPAA